MVTDHKISLYGLTLQELESFAQSLGEQAFRGRQLYHWLNNQRVADFSKMKNLPASFREKLTEQATPGRLGLALKGLPANDGAQKFLFELTDGLRVESVYLPDSPGDTVCISSQVGCALGCTFCATGKMGFYRNLTAGEIVLQVLEVEWLTGVKISNVVFMGMGEPLYNYEQTVKAVKLLSDENGIGLSARRLTVSTVGLVPMIERWQEENPPAKLAISLHAPTDEQRMKLMPVNKAYPLEMLFKSLRRYAHVTKHSITFEYIMIEGFNDRKVDAVNLGNLLKNIPSKMNLIRLHPTGSGLQPSSDYAIDRFMGYLVAEGVRCTLRQSRGVDAEAACGMLFSQEPVRPSKARAWESSSD
jgi:23S rRNA (adenine2503-C2)-methyltransferase